MTTAYEVTAHEALPHVERLLCELSQQQLVNHGAGDSPDAEVATLAPAVADER